MLHFELSEFDSPDEIGSGKYMDEKFLQMLDDARSIANISFTINSGFRTKSHNAYVGGKITAPTNMDTQQIFIAPIQEVDSLLLMPLRKQDSIGLELVTPLSTLITTQIRTVRLFGLTSTAGHTLTYE